MLKEGIKYQDVTPEFEKDRNYEEFLEAFNDHLGSFEEPRYRDLEERVPNVHVIGVPRSGTTMLAQLISSELEVGYINNFIARFWKAPVAAIRISRKVLGDDYRSDLTSELGNTDSIYGLNEFNYFWYDMLDYEGHHVKTEEEASQIDWQRVAKVMKNILWAYEKPVLFKSFMLGWHAQRMQQALEKTCFVWIKRDPTDNALSLLDMRRKLLGTIDEWASFKPRQFNHLKELTPFEQVAGQVYHLEEVYEKQLKELPESNYLILNYEEVCKEPEKALLAVKNLINKNGGNIGSLKNRISSQEPSTKSAETHRDYNRVYQAIESFYS